MIKKFLKMFPAKKNVNTKSLVKANSVEKQIYEKPKMKILPTTNIVDEYFFKVINWNKINYEQETDQDILRSYDEFDEGEYPMHLKDDFLSNLHFYSNANINKLQFEIFSSIELLHRPLYKNEDFIQQYFIENYNTCFFYDENISSEIQSYSELLKILTLKDFTEIVLPNLIPKLFLKLEKDSKKRLYNNWEFYKDIGNFRNGSNLLFQLYNHLPFPDISKVSENDKLQFYTYANIEELANFAVDIQLEGLIWNAEFFNKSYDNDIFEQIVPRYKYDKFEIKPKSRYVCNDLKNNPDKINSNLEILNRWFLDENNIAPSKYI